MPFDKVEEEYIDKPKKWETKSLKGFMFYFGIISTLFDIACFLVLWYVLKYNTMEMATHFQTGWFLFGIISQTLIIHTIRTHKFPFVQSRASKQLLISSVAVVLITLFIGFTSFASTFDLVPLGTNYLAWLGILMLGYMIIAQIMKKIYIKIHSEWI